MFWLSCVNENYLNLHVYSFLYGEPNAEVFCWQTALPEEREEQ